MTEAEGAVMRNDPFSEPYTAVLLRFVVLVGLLYMPVLVFQVGTWLPFAGASAYLLWELRRLHSAFGALTGARSEPDRPEPARTETLGH